MAGIERGFVPLSQLEAKSFTVETGLRKKLKIVIEFGQFPEGVDKERIGVNVRRLANRARIGGFASVLVHTDSTKESVLYTNPGPDGVLYGTPSALWSDAHLSVKTGKPSEIQDAKKTAITMNRSLQHEVADAGSSNLTPKLQKHTIGNLAWFALPTALSFIATKVSHGTITDIPPLIKNLLLTYGAANLWQWGTYALPRFIYKYENNGFRFSLFSGIQPDRVALVQFLRGRKLVKYLPNQGEKAVKK